jgi:hypothetical protein
LPVLGFKLANALLISGERLADAGLTGLLDEAAIAAEKKSLNA